MTFRASFRQRLCRAQDRGHLSVADLARWFERPYSVVWYWTTEDRRTRVGESDREVRLKLLEKAVAKGASVRAYKLVLKHDTPRGRVAVSHDATWEEVGNTDLVLNKRGDGWVRVKARRRRV